MRLPAPKQKPKFAMWRYERGLDLRATAALMTEVAKSKGLMTPDGGKVCSHELVRTLCLPFGHPMRSEPSELVLDVILLMTLGEVTRADFSAPVEIAA